MTYPLPRDDLLLVLLLPKYYLLTTYMPILGAANPRNRSGDDSTKMNKKRVPNTALIW